MSGYSAPLGTTERIQSDHFRAVTYKDLDSLAAETGYKQAVVYFTSGKIDSEIHFRKRDPARTGSWDELRGIIKRELNPEKVKELSKGQGTVFDSTEPEELEVPF